MYRHVQAADCAPQGASRIGFARCGAPCYFAPVLHVKLARYGAPCYFARVHHNVQNAARRRLHIAVHDVILHVAVHKVEPFVWVE